MNRLPLLLALLCTMPLSAETWHSYNDLESQKELSFRFRSNSPDITIRYGYDCSGGVEECDLYIINNNGEVIHLGGTGAMCGDTLSHTYTNIDYTKSGHKKRGFEFQLLTPMGCEWLDIGVKEGCFVEFAMPRKELPIVIYTTKRESVDSGAKRWEAELELRMDRAVRIINEVEQMEAKALIVGDIEKSDMASLRELYSTTPIIIKGEKSVEQLEAELRKVLNCPVGEISTTIPVSQRRVGGTEWQDQCHMILDELKITTAKSAILGNSITQGWGSDSPHAKRYRKGARESWERYMGGFVNLGLGADRIENLLWRVYNDQMEVIPFERIIVMIGTNNLNAKTSSEDIAVGIENLVAQIKLRQPQAKITVVGILPRKDRAWADLQLINKEIKRGVKRQKVEYKCVGSALMDKNNIPIAEYYADRVHLTQAGYMALGKALMGK